MALVALGLAGFGVFVEGVREIYPPAALILGGALLVALANVLRGEQGAE